jgi:hypothetical protein
LKKFCSSFSLLLELSEERNFLCGRVLSKNETALTRSIEQKCVLLGVRVPLFFLEKRKLGFPKKNYNCAGWNLHF